MFEDIKTYAFKSYEIESCSECPLFVDFSFCNLKSPYEAIQYTNYADDKRPDNCPLKELI